MIEIIRANRKVLLKDGLSKMERYRLRRINLLVIQEKFFEVMEKNPKIFKISLLTHRRKAILKERRFGKVKEDFIDFEPDEGEEVAFKKSKVVGILLTP